MCMRVFVEQLRALHDVDDAEYHECIRMLTCADVCLQAAMCMRVFVEQLRALDEVLDLLAY